MDEKKAREAIEAFQGQVNWLKRIDDKSCEEARKDCIEYFETAIEALEKQLPKKLEEYHYEEPGEKPYIKYGCGNGCRMQPTRSSKYCNQCGQRIDWSE